MKHQYAAEMLFNTPLLIEEGRKEMITEYFLKRMQDDAPLIGAYSDDAPRAKTRTYYRMGDVAIIPVHGLLLHRQFSMEAQCGMTSYQTLAAMVTQALDDSTVNKILLDIDSGGGMVAGLFDFVDMLVEAGKEKTLWAFSNENAFSAAYAIASAAEKIFVSRTSGVGSIGVVTQHVDWSRYNEEMGITITPIYAGERKIDWSPDFPIKPEALAIFQKEVNATYDLFVNLVAQNRGIGEDEVRATQAGLFYGEDAVQINLADDVSSFDEVLGSFLSVGTATEVPIVSKMGKLKMRLFGKMAKQKPEAEVVDPAKTTQTETPAADAPAADAPAAAKDGDEGKKDDKEPEAATEGDEDDNEDQPPADEALVDAPADPADVMQAAIDAGQPQLAIDLVRAKATMTQVRERLDATSEIMRLCAMAGVPTKAEGFITQNLTVPQVKDKLLHVLANRSEKSDVSAQPDPEKVAAVVEATAAQNPVMADAERRRKDWESKHKRS